MSVYPRDFFDNEDFFCQHDNCSNLLEDAFKASCGHSLCADCVGEIEYTAGVLKRQAQCPIKDCEKGFQYSSDDHLREQIRQSHVSCVINGCNWSGTYRAYSGHMGEHHPPDICEPVSKRKASHILATIQDKDSLDSTALQLRQNASSLILQAESIEQVTGGANYVERVSTDSLKANVSNNSLKRANELQIEMFLDKRSQTLDADPKIRFGITPENENLPVQQAANRKRNQEQMVIGNTACPAPQLLPPIESTQLTPQLNSLNLTPSSPVREQGPRFTNSAGASPTACKPKRRGLLPPANPFQTPSPRLPLSPNCQQAMSPLTPITNLPPLMVPAPLQATPYVPPPNVPPPALLKAAARKMSFSPDATPKKPPPVSDECSQCKENKRLLATQSTEVVDVLITQNKTLKNSLVDMIKNCHCNRSKENRNQEPFRGRLNTF